MQLLGANKLMGNTTGRFDGHAHVFTTKLPLVKDRRYSPKADATLDAFVHLLRGADLNGALLVQPSFLGTDNSYLLTALQDATSYDDLEFRGVCVLKPDATRAELDQLNRAGIVGIRLNLVGRPDHFDIEEWQPLLKQLDGFGWHVELHCEGNRIRSVVESLSRHCGTLVIDHFGLPETGNSSLCDGQRSILEFPTDRLFVKVSAPYRVFKNTNSHEAASLCSKYFVYLFEHLGPERLLWGSDWPWTRFEDGQTYEDTVKWHDQWIEDVAKVAV